MKNVLPNSAIYQIKNPRWQSDSASHGPAELKALPAHRVIANLQWTQFLSGERNTFVGYVPEIARLDNGDLILVFRWLNPCSEFNNPNTPSQDRAPVYQLAYSVSTDLGMTWSLPR